MSTDVAFEPTRSFLDYALFLTFFPSFGRRPHRSGERFPSATRDSAPPIARADLGWGAYLILLGLFEKTVLADFVLAPAADRVFSASRAVLWSDAWLGTLAFAGQIFFDFSGYSTIGIGAALCFGFKLKRNFHFPYAAIGFSDFWRRWHISLSSWLRDYLYIPLGGNRKGTRKYLRQPVGDDVTGRIMARSFLEFFAIWGGLARSLLDRRARSCAMFALQSFSLDAQSRTGVRWSAAIFTFFAVNVAWVYFRATKLTPTCEPNLWSVYLPATL